MLKLALYSAKGIRKGTVNLPSDLMQKENLPLLAQAIRVYENRSHPSLSKVKTRGEVKASTRKIYRQKGTGNARHGAISAPIFVGGGIAHGPKGIKRRLKLSRKMKKKALGISLSLMAGEKRIFIVDGISSLIKTRNVSDLIGKITEKEDITGNFGIRVALSEKNKSVYKAMKNIKNVSVQLYSDLSALDVYKSGILIIDKDALIEKGTKGIKSITRINTERKIVEKTRSAGKNARKKSHKSVKKLRK